MKKMTYLLYFCLPKKGTWDNIPTVWEAFQGHDPRNLQNEKLPAQAALKRTSDRHES